MDTRALMAFLIANRLELCVEQGLIRVYLNSTPEVSAYRMTNNRPDPIKEFHALVWCVSRKGPVSFRRNNGDAGTPWETAASLNELLLRDNAAPRESSHSGLLVLPASQAPRLAGATAG